MAESLSSSCTSLKKAYDSCFNAWFEGYLEPAVTSSTTAEARAAYSKQKAAEFDQNCGKIWTEYKNCLQAAVKEKGLDQLLRQAREENPLKELPRIEDSGSSTSS